MLSTAQAAVKLQELQREADANRNIYEQFLSRYKTTNEQRSLQTAQTKIVSLRDGAGASVATVAAAVAGGCRHRRAARLRVRGHHRRSRGLRLPLRGSQDQARPQLP